MLCEPQFGLLLPELRGNPSKTEKRMRALEKCTDVIIVMYTKRKTSCAKENTKEGRQHCCSQFPLSLRGGGSLSLGLQSLGILQKQCIKRQKSGGCCVSHEGKSLQLHRRLNSRHVSLSLGALNKRRFEKQGDCRQVPAFARYLGDVTQRNQTLWVRARERDDKNGRTASGSVVCIGSSNAVATVLHTREKTLWWLVCMKRRISITSLCSALRMLCVVILFFRLPLPSRKKTIPTALASWWCARYVLLQCWQ